MLGNHKVTRPKASKNDAEEPMRGNHQVNRAPTPTNKDSEEPKVTLGQVPAGIESGMPVGSPRLCAEFIRVIFTTHQSRKSAREESRFGRWAGSESLIFSTLTR